MKDKPFSETFSKFERFDPRRRQVIRRSEPPLESEIEHSLKATIPPERKAKNATS
jgi:hypothetical protein